MKLEFDRSFSKSLNRVMDSNILKKIENIMTEIESAKSLKDIRNLKKLVGFQNYYRIKLGSYRIGIELIDKSKIRFIIITHRKDIYKKFP